MILREGEEPGDLSIYRFQENDGIWLVEKKDERICVILFDDSDPDSFRLWICGDNIGEHATVDEHIKKFAWENVPSCGSCGSGCSPEIRRRKVFGKDFDSVCTAQLMVTMMFSVSDAKTSDYLKKIADIRKNDILKNS